MIISHRYLGIVLGLLFVVWFASGIGMIYARGMPSLTEGPRLNRLEPSAFPAIDPGAWDALLPGRSLKEISYRRILGRPYFMVRSSAAWSVETTAADPAHGGSVAGPTDIGRVLITAETLAVRKEAFALDSLMSRVREAYPETEIVEVRLLEEYDSYHYSRELDAPLPIMRVKFDDPDRTWIYIDPASGELATTVHRLDRVERWIYNGFHSLDFGFWYYNRPVWDIGVVVLSLGGMAMSTIGLFLGIRRLTRG